MGETYKSPFEIANETGLTLDQVSGLQKRGVDPYVAAKAAGATAEMPDKKGTSTSQAHPTQEDLKKDEHDKLLYGRRRDVINLNSERYKGLGKRRRLRNDLNKSAGQAFVWNGQKASLAGELQKDGFTRREAKRLLKTRTGSGKYNYSETSQYDPETNEGRFNQKLYDYFNDNPDATVARWDPQAKTSTQQQQPIKRDEKKFFSGFGGNDQYLNRLYSITADKSKYKTLLDEADRSKDGLVSPDELNTYAATWYKNSPFFRNGVVDPMNYLFQSQMGITDDQLLSQSGYYNMPIWYNWKQHKDDYVPSSGWSRFDEDGSGNNNYYVDDANAYKDFLKKKYGLDDRNVAQIFGNDYASALSKIGYTPSEDHANYFNYDVMDKFDTYLQNNIYNSPNWKFENQRWNYIPTNKKGGVLKMNNINFYQKGGSPKTGKPAQKAEQQSAQPTEDQVIQMAIFGLIGYGATQQQQISVEDAIKQVAALATSEPDQLQQIVEDQDLVNTGYKIAQQQEPEVTKQLMEPGVAADAVQQVMQQQVRAARHGAKLNYIKGLKGECPDGYYKAYYKAGGQVCPVCKKKQEQQQKVESAKCGKKMRRGAVTKAMNGIRTEMFNGGGKPKPKTRTLHRDDKVAVDVAAVPRSKRVIERVIMPTPFVGVNDTIYRTYPDRQSAGNWDKRIDDEFVVYNKITGKSPIRSKGYWEVSRLFDPARILGRRSMKLVDADGQYNPYPEDFGY